MWCSVFILAVLVQNGIKAEIIGDFIPSVKQENDSPWTPVTMNHVFQLPSLTMAPNTIATSQPTTKQSSVLDEAKFGSAPTQLAPIVKQTKTIIPLAPIIAIPMEARSPAGPNRRPAQHHGFLWGRSKKPVRPPPPMMRDGNKKLGRREPTRPKIVPSAFLKKIARKVFFPDNRRNDNHQGFLRRPQQHPPPVFALDQHGKVLFPQADAQSQLDTQRLRRVIQQALCAFSTVSTGLNGESCIES